MERSFRGLVVCGLSLGLLACSSNEGSLGESSFSTVVESSPQTRGRLLSEEEALDADLNTIAATNGWTHEQAVRNHESAEAVGRVAAELAARRPEAFVGSAVSRDPDAPPTLFMKGPVDEVTRGMVAAENVAIEIADRQRYSFAELEQRSSAAVESIKVLRVAELAAAIDITRGVIAIYVRPKPGITLDAAAVLSRLAPPLQRDVEVIVMDAQVTLSNPMAVVDASAVGGDGLTLNFALVCTSGFIVNMDGGGRAIATAGHCAAISETSDLFQFDSPRLTLIGEHRGANGDLEIHSARAFDDSPASLLSQFFTDSEFTTTRVTGVEPRTSISVGEQICGFGQRTDERVCETVTAVSIACGPTEGGFTHERMVQMSARLMRGGDSGGPWFVGGRAYGLHSGACPGADGALRDIFTPAALLPAALNASVAVD